MTKNPGGGGGGGGGGTESSWQIIQIRNKNWVGCGGRCVWSAGRVGGGGGSVVLSDFFWTKNPGGGGGGGGTGVFSINLQGIVI